MKTNFVINQSKKARFVAHNNAIIKGYGEVLAIWGTVLEVAVEMDGKVYNKRFNEAVNDRTAEKYGRVGICDPYNLGKELYIYINSRSYNSPDSCGWCYIEKELYYTDIKLETILKDGRIDAEKAKEVLTPLMERINERLNLHKDAVKYYDRNVTKRAKALTALANAFEEINDLLKPRELHAYDWEKMLKYNDSI